MKKSTTFRTAAILFVAILMTSCSHTYLTSTWHDVNKKPMAFDKIAVVVMAPSKSNRGVIENAMVNQFKANGMKAISTMGIFPRAGDPKAMEENDKDALETIVREKVEANNIDALMIIALLDKEKEEHYVEGTSYGMTMPYYGGYGSPYNYPMNSFPYHNYSYYGYYSHAYSTINTPGYYYNTTSYYVETSLFDVENGELLWTGQTKTTDPVSINREADTFAQVVIEGIMRDRALEVK